MAADMSLVAKSATDIVKLLKAGGSDYPHALLTRAGVDLATPAPYRALIARMNAIMDQIESILDQREAKAAP